MKKIIMILLTLFLLGKMPSDVWKQGTPEQQGNLVQKIIEELVPAVGCHKGILYGIEKGEDIYFIFDCEEEIKEKPTAIKISDT